MLDPFKLLKDRIFGVKKILPYLRNVIRDVIMLLAKSVNQLWFLRFYCMALYNSHKGEIVSYM